LVVVRGYRYREDLRALRPYIREYRPVLLAVDAGADALLEAGYRPHVIIGDMDSVSDEALQAGAELVVHAYPDGRAPGMTRLKGLDLAGTKLPAPGTSEDVAMLLADELGASLIVAVGTHFSLEDFLDKGRDGMASTFLTRLRIGSKLVDAKGIARFNSSRRRPRFRELSFMLVAAATPIVAVLCLAPAGQNLLRIIGLWLRVHSPFHGR
ncbi:MAG TPA: putative cytokinetic ring protein SteA, partial [Chthonomonadaceae bacterium]|nr:putative cytokinetic ring protein SteA [Chthonomonadaceae bacterium]